MCGITFTFKVNRKEILFFLNLDISKLDMKNNIHVNVHKTKNALYNIRHAHILYTQYITRSRRGRDRMVVIFTTTCAISAYHH